MATTLEAIITKVRRLTSSPSVNQISDDDIKEYVNSFVLYDLPEHLRLFALRSKLTFYTQPYIDTYETNTTVLTHPLYNFKNIYTTVHPPLYIDGSRSTLYQDRGEFFNQYPPDKAVKSIGAYGDGVTLNFAGTLTNIPILRNQVHFSSIATDNTVLEMHDNGNEILSGPGGVGNIDYITGVYTLNFGVAPGLGENIESHTNPYKAGKPDSVLYYDNKFVVRPIPDSSYSITLDAFRRPIAVLDGVSPELEQWFSYIAYGAAKKIFEDRMDSDSVQIIMSEFKQQELLVLRRTIVQHKNERTSTIYTNYLGY